MLSIVVPGKPQGKGRARAFIAKNGRIGHYTPEKTKTYEGIIRTIAAAELGLRGPTHEPISLGVVMQFTPPVSWPKWKLQRALLGEIGPTTKPDADNVLKAVKDALNGVVWVDDAQVIEMQVSKQYATVAQLFINVNRVDCEAVRTAKRGDA